MVDREITYRFEDLERFEVVEKVVTLTCVSNPVGGELISNATWTGYRVRDLLADAGVHADADMVLSKSIDGFTAGTPVEALTDDGRDAGDRHERRAAARRARLPGPAGRARVCTATSRPPSGWSTWSSPASTARRRTGRGSGWSRARADQDRVPHRRAAQRRRTCRAGPVTFGGVAWAQNRGVRDVEVQIDDGDWQRATLGDSYSNDTWRLWSFDWDAQRAGAAHDHGARHRQHRLHARPPSGPTPIPDGATGWHSVTFAVR